MAGSPVAASAVALTGSPGFAAHLGRIIDFGLRRTLQPEPGWAAHAPNHKSREVKSGHYVPVAPEPLPQPELVVVSPAAIKTCLDDMPLDCAKSPAFTSFFSGDLAGSIAAAGVSETGVEDPELTAAWRKWPKDGWASGYALSIMGEELKQQCPFKTGNGYGDGRAMSVLEVAIADDEDAPPAFEAPRWEFQLKGAGRTPYCRGADGRAVLRSSVREFVVSEAMHALGVPTTRALCLIESTTESVQRPWYRDGSSSPEPDVMIRERIAISTRVAPSFIRVGQLELFGRRARDKEHPNALVELVQIVTFACEREYPELGPVPLPGDAPAPGAAAADSGSGDPRLAAATAHVPFLQHVVKFAETFADRLAALVGHWIRVGFCQGNFNADNCAVGGRTLDYGPFGFMAVFDPQYQSWTGGGQHYSFLSQPAAATANYRMFLTALAPLFDAQLTPGDDAPKDARHALNTRVQKLVGEFAAKAQRAVALAFAAKVGLPGEPLEPSLQVGLLEVLQSTPTDYTMFFRALSSLPADASSTGAFRRVFYKADLAKANDLSLPATTAAESIAWDGRAAAEERIDQWLVKWHAALVARHGGAGGDAWKAAVVAQMKCVNPRYVPREGVLADAYKAADKRDSGPVEELLRAFSAPYADDDGTPAGAAQSAKFEQRASLRSLGTGGLAVMS